MSTPMTILSASQGVLREPPRSEADYWARFEEGPHREDRPFWHVPRVGWIRWPLRGSADRL